MRIGKDKLMHAAVCFVLDVALAVMGIWIPWQRVAFVALGIGGAKEIYDMRHEGHDAEWLDLLADFIGAVAGEVAVLILQGGRVG